MIDKYINLMIKNGMILQSDEEIYKYKVTCLVEKIVMISVMILISLFFKETTGVIIFIVTFFWLRSRTGGFHLDSFSGCFICTISIEIVVILLIKSQIVPIVISNILSAIASIIILVLGASNHPNMDYEKEEYYFNKKYARVIVIIEFLAILFFSGLEISGEYIQAMEYSVILTAILLIMAFTMGQHKKIT